MKQTPLIKLTRTNTLVIMSDIHEGAVEHDEAAFDEALRWAWDAEAMLYLNGDLTDNATPVGKDVALKLLAQVKQPTEQVKALVAKLRRFAKKGRIAGMTEGNHDARTKRASLLDLCELVADVLGVEYHRVGGYVRFLAGSELYAGWIQHGRTAAKNIWLELDRYLARAPLADFVAAGHNHALDARRVHHFRIGRAGAEEIGTAWQIRTGCYLGYAEYLRALGLPPSGTGSPVLRFAPKEHRLIVDVETLRWPR